MHATEKIGQCYYETELTSVMRGFQGKVRSEQFCEQKTSKQNEGLWSRETGPNQSSTSTVLKGRCLPPQALLPHLTQDDSLPHWEEY